MTKKIIVVLLTILIAATTAWATYSLGAVVSNHLGNHTDIFKQTASDVTTKADVFAARPVASYRAFCLWVYNSGAVNLTDLDILFSDENANWTKAINMTDAQPFVTDTNSGCTTTLNTVTKCVVCLENNPGIGWVKVQASAGSTTEVSVTLIGYHE